MDKEKKEKKRVKSTLLEILGPATRKGVQEEDPLSAILDDEIKTLAKSAKLKTLKAYALEKEKEIRDLKNLLGMNEAKPVNVNESSKPRIMDEVDVRVAMQLAELPDEQKKKVIETYAMLKMAESQASNPAALLPLLIGFTRENPRASTEEIYGFAKVAQETMKTAGELLKEKYQPKDEASKTFIELITKVLEAQQKASDEKFERLVDKLEKMNQPGLLDALILNQDVYNRLKDLGFFSPPKPQYTDPTIQLKIEEMRMRHEKELKQMEMNFQLELQRLQQEQNRLLGMVGMFRQMGHAIASSVLEEPATTHQTQAPPPTQGEVVTLNCPNCNNPITFPTTAKTVVCPKCRRVLEIKREEEKEEASQGEG